MDIAAIYAILASFNGILASKDRKLIAPELVSKYRALRNLQLLVAAIFTVSILLPFSSSVRIGSIQLNARYIVWTSTFIFSRGTWILKRMGKL